VLAWSARYRFLAGQYEDGLRGAEEALALAERFGLDDVRVHALTTIGPAKEWLGDTTGRRDLERAIEIGRAANSAMTPGALNNLSVVLDMTDTERVRDLAREALLEAERLGDVPLLRFLRGNIVASFWLLGEWDEAIATADAFIAECERGSPHILEGPSRLFRGYIKLARGERMEALEDFATGLELAREIPKDAQTMAPALIRNSWANLQLGRVADARELFAEALSHLRNDPNARPWAMAEVAFELGEIAPMREVLGRLPTSTGREAMLAVLDGSFEQAAEQYATANIRLFEAEARLRAAEQLLAAGRTAHGETQLQKALAFYRSTGATLFIDRGEALLAKTA
jgi:tetratricopeptide (TPR) repeat protein